MTEHLNEQELDEVLIGTGSTAAEGHVTGCEVCQAKIKEFRSTIALFNQASLGWAEAKSNTLSRELPPRRAGWLPIPASSLSLAAMLVVVLSLAWSAGVHRFADAGIALHRAVTRDVSGDVPVADESASEIANDNAILRDIDSALYKAEPSPVDLYRNVEKKSGPRYDSGQEQD